MVSEWSVVLLWVLSVMKFGEEWFVEGGVCVVVFELELLKLCVVECIDEVVECLGVLSCVIWSEFELVYEEYCVYCVLMCFFECEFLVVLWVV